MTNLKLKRDGDYRYMPLPEGEMVVIHLSYWKDVRVRGAYVSINIEDHKDDGSFSCMPFDGISGLVAPMDRKSDKVLATIAEAIDAKVPEAAELFRTDKKGAVALLFNAYKAATQPSWTAVTA